jgi:tetratricopeptide (TPR) repeat protein
LSRISPLLLLILILSGSALVYLRDSGESPAVPAGRPDAAASATAQPFTEASTLSGAYLAGRYAQRHFDWSASKTFYNQILTRAPEDAGLLKKVMLLAVGNGQVEEALLLARRVQALERPEHGALSSLVLAVGDFKNKNYKGAAEQIRKMPTGGLSDFILPLLNSWAGAALGKNETEGLDQNTIHLYHAILIDDFLGQSGHIEKLLEKAQATPDLGPEDLVRIGDLYAHIGQPAKAVALYTNILNQAPDDPDVTEKIRKIEQGEKESAFARVQSAEQGVAEALYDMARLTAQEYSDESARVFAQMAIYLDPGMTKARFLLASLEARNDRLDDAIATYLSIAPGDTDYAQSRRNAAELMNEAGHTQDALKELDGLAEQTGDIEAMVQKGDLYRMDNQFSRAIDAYDKAETMMGGTITSAYWQVHYVRGMAYEQNGQWDKAEADLQEALKFRPNHPYILNYLGYAWADRGEKLEQALSMIQRAMAVRPDDGYITDSLGWIYFKTGQYREAVPYLEQAVELMPYDSTVNDHLGDAYWRVGRRREARFQWERARNHTEDQALIATLERKITDGLPEADEHAAGLPVAGGTGYPADQQKTSHQ